MVTMTFIIWLENHTSFERQYKDTFIHWKNLVDYGEYTFDYLEIRARKVLFTYEKKSWGETEEITTEYSFKEFIEKYENNELK